MKCPSLGRRYTFKIPLLYCRSIVAVYSLTVSNDRAGVQPAGVVYRGRRPTESAQWRPGGRRAVDAVRAVRAGTLPA